jgi:hypothetical protein
MAVGALGRLPEPAHALLARIEEADDVLHADLAQLSPEIPRRIEVEQLRDSNHAYRLPAPPAPFGASGATDGSPSTATPVIHLTISSTVV